jgi:hypothetical protein
MVKVGPTTQKPALICWQVGVDAAYNASWEKTCVAETGNEDRPLHNGLKRRHQHD